MPKADNHQLRHVERGALALIPTPERTATWVPVGHEKIIATVSEALDAAGFTIQASRFCLSRRGDARMFATMDLSDQLADGVTLAIGVRNSIDKSLPLGFIAGSRVRCCENLAFRSDLMVAQKHSRLGMERFAEAISLAVQALDTFQKEESTRIEDLQEKVLTDETAESIVLRAFETGIVTRLLPDVIREWRKPSFPEFQPRTAWSLYNAFTTVLGSRATSNPEKHAANTIKLGAMFNAVHRRRRDPR
jgi:hypothetical protein